ncbi:MAG TPA: hypothetical protein VGM25_16750 [Caulobacteraceae bacterium]
MRGAVERADQQNRKRQEDLVLAPDQRLVFYDAHGAEQHFTGAVLGALVRSDRAGQGLSPAGQANARSNIAAGSLTGTPGGAAGQVQFNAGGGFGGFTLGGDARLNPSTGALTLAAVNADVGAFGDGTHVGQFTVNAKGLVTAASSVAIPAFSAGGAGLAPASGGGAANFLRADGAWAPAVVSVGLAMPGQFTVSGSPVTASGTLAAAWAAQGAGTVLAGPPSGAAAAPAFRALASADLPVGSSSQLGAVQVDGTTITASGGVISAVGGGGGGGGLIASGLVSGTSTLNYTLSSIPGTYNHLKFIIIGRSVATDSAVGNIALWFNGDTTTANYAATYFAGDARGNLPPFSGLGQFISNFASSASSNISSCVLIIDIYAYAQTLIPVQWASDLRALDTVGRELFSQASYSPSPLTAINSITVTPFNQSSVNVAFADKTEFWLLGY